MRGGKTKREEGEREQGESERWRVLREGGRQ